jgi:hypothetical protein
VSYLQCPECRLTVPAAAYYLRGDECPRCLTTMQPFHRKRFTPSSAAPGTTAPPRAVSHPGEAAAPAPATR